MDKIQVILGDARTYFATGPDNLLLGSGAKGVVPLDKVKLPPAAANRLKQDAGK